MVRYGSRPLRDIGEDGAALDRIAPHLRSYAEAMAYPPNQAYIGNLDPDALAGMPRPWFGQGLAGASPQGPFGEIIPETELLLLLKGVDRFRLVHLLPEFLERAGRAAAPGPLLTEREAAALQPTPREQVEASLAAGEAISLWEGERLAGCFLRGHEEDEALTAPVLLENLLCKATGVLALRRLLGKASGQTPPEDIPFVIAGSEEAVGDRYQRGGGNMAKAVGESAGLTEATGMDVKAFCASTLYGLLTAAAYVKSGLFERVAVVSGGSLAKLGMKYRAHLDKGMPILEDVLAGMALLVERPNGGRDPVVRMDTVGLHRIGAGSSQQAIIQALSMTPLEKAGYALRDIDKFVTEMHNPEVTEPAGGGNVPAGNYKMIGALAAVRGEIPREEIPGFASRHGIPGYAPTQGHIASAVCYLAHACQGIREGRFRRALFMAKGSLFLGRMTDLSDGVSFLVEAGPSGE
jgi:betaine reductase